MMKTLLKENDCSHIYCQHCHGEKGDGNGTLKVKGEKFPVVSYFDETPHGINRRQNVFQHYKRKKPDGLACFAGGSKRALENNSIH